jgi:hypothetical protein
VALAALSPATAVAGGGTQTRVSPHRGGPGKVFTVGFTAPQPSGRQGVVTRSYQVTASRSACRGNRVSGATTEAAAASAGERVRVQLRPGPPGARWCRGRFTGKVTMTEGPYCQAGQPCPAKAAAIRPCPEGASGTTGCGCCPGAGVKCPDQPPGDCQPSPGFPTRISEIGRFAFRVR